MSLRERLRSLVPTRAQIEGNRWLRWLGPLLRRPRLWRWSRRGVALGVALGMFFGLLIPVAQIPLSVGAAVLLRANVPAAAVSTLVTNPLTFGPLYYAAYKLGHWITGTTDRAQSPDSTAAADTSAGDPQLAGLPQEEMRLWHRLLTVGKPLLLGLAIIATLTGLLSYALIALVWHGWTRFKRRKRRLPPEP